METTLKQYWLAGLATLPTKPDKSPDVKGTWKEGVKDLSQYKHGIGVICGNASQGLECIDFDNHFGDSQKVMAQFLTGDVKKIYEKYKLPIEKTLSGGFHLLYRCAVISGNQKLASRPKKDKNDKWVPDTIIETRGEGGYFVIAPTEGYKVVRNDILRIAKITPEEREVLLENARSFNTWHKVVPVEQEERERPGDVYNTKPEAAKEAKSALLEAGWTEVRDKEWRRPEKKHGISATFGRVAENVFYCFSSSAPPFDPNSAYTPFQVVTLLKYNGDFKAFATKLAKIYSEELPVNEQEKEEKKIGGSGLLPVTESEYEGILRKAHINLQVPVTNPPIVMRIKDYEIGEYVEKRMFTLGNFSCITGKSKSKKTFLTSLFLASATSNSMVERKFISNFPENKKYALLFDTEQSEYDAYVTAKRVHKILGAEWPNFGAFDLREYTPRQRCAIINHALSKQFKGNVGYVVIDGIADLATAINDEEEASRVASLLMKWTKIHNIHITTVIHQNKNDNFATGHLGSAIMKKAEMVISVTKSANDRLRSDIACDYARGTADFNDFEIEIDYETGLPHVVSIENMIKKEDDF